MCANDLMAAGAIQALQDARLRVPREVSVTGRDDAPVASLLRPRLATLRKPVAEISAEAMGMLLEQLDGRKPDPLGPDAYPGTGGAGDDGAGRVGECRP